MPLPSIETRRLSLRPWRPDWDATLFTDADIRYLLWERHGVSLDSAIRDFRAEAEEAVRHGLGYWAISSKDAPAETIGLCGFRRRDAICPVEVLFAVVAGRRRRGVATEAVSAALQYGFRTGLFDRVQAVVGPCNSACIRALERLGMKPDARSWISECAEVYFSATAGDFASVAPAEQFAQPDPRRLELNVDYRVVHGSA